MTAAAALGEQGFVVLPHDCPQPEDAWAAADHVITRAAAKDELCGRLGTLDVVAQYTMPPPATAQRPFQVLHIDFGVPIGRDARVDVARYTALYVDRSMTASGAATRIVPLVELSLQRNWPAATELAARLKARDDDPDAVEGVLARIVEAADNSVQLPSKQTPGFQCGLEFDTIEDELEFLRAHGVDAVPVERRLVLRPGETLIFDNLRCAHGRLGVRTTGALHQRCYGFAALTPPDQQTVLMHVLGQLTGCTSSPNQQSKTDRPQRDPASS